MPQQTSPMDRLVEALARKAVRDYLREEGFLPPAPPTDEERLAGETTLYRYFDAEGRLLYVGVARDFQARDIAHRSSSAWYPQMARTETVKYTTRAEALAAERQAIRTERPLYNEQGAIGRTDESEGPA